MVSVCLPYDALSQHLPSYLGFSYLGCGVTLHSCSSKVRPCSLPWTKSISSLATPPDLEHGVVPLGPLAPKQATRLGCGLLLLAASLKYSCLENPMNRMKRQSDRILKEELPRSVGAQYALEISAEITPERMKGWSQTKNNTQLWMRLVIEARSDAVKSNIA